MISGKGTLFLRGGRRIAVGYQFGSHHDETRGGYLLCDTSTFDPGSFCDKLLLTCEDGTSVEVAVVHFGDRHLAVVGHALPAVHDAA
jgi:NADH:ubiquinone oxidoreductase subunit F (NADH-binding)